MKAWGKTVCAVLAGALMMSCMAGCQVEAPESGSESSLSNAGISGLNPEGYDFNGETVTIASTYIKMEDMVPGRNTDTDRLLQRIEEVEKAFHVNVEFREVDAGNYWDNMAPTIMAEEPFGDIMETTPWYAGGWIQAGAIRDVSQLSREVGIDFSDGTWSKVVAGDMTYGSSIYGFNRERDAVQVLCLYNKKLFRAAGLTDPNELIAQDKKWDFATFQDYARQLVKYDSSGEVVQWGVGTTCGDMVLAGMIMSNGGSVIEQDEDGLLKLGLTDAKALAAIEVFNNMCNTDKSLVAFGYQKAAEFLPSGKLGMLLCEEWVLDEYVNDYADKNNIDRSDYGLTYFPVGPSGTDYLDPSMGGNAMFIPKTLSDERAKMALIVYAALYAPDETLSREQEIQMRAEELFSDEASVGVYTDILLNWRMKSNDVSRSGIFESFRELSTAFMDGGGTPSSMVNGLAPEMQALIDDSPYTAILKEQMNGQG
ncbi:MAG TPA: extracellular solute-binding protein [Firmicutes bacterium]|nr:extracellular solute-binding protein [Bacillota bacterium]